MTKNTLRERLTSIRNAVRIKSPGVEIIKTRTIRELSRLLLQEGLIEGFSEIPSSSKIKKCMPVLFLRLKYYRGDSVIADLQCLSRPSLRVYISYKEIPKIFGGLGLVVLSTSRGLITGQQAKRNKLGGELLCSVW